MIGEKEEGYELIEYELAARTPRFKIVGNLVLFVALLVGLTWPWLRTMLPLPAHRIDVFGNGPCAVMHRDFVSRFAVRQSAHDQCDAEDDPYHGQP